MALRRGEKGILIGAVVVVLLMMGWRVMNLQQVSEDKGIPYYTTATQDLMKQLQDISIVRCDQAAWRFLGLSLAGWNVLVSLGLACVGLWGARVVYARPVAED